MKTTQSSAGPLDGIRILDLSSVVMGPYATQILGDLGADVIKLESPAGDNMRAVGPMRNPGMGAMYLHLNRNKRSIVLDLKTPQGRQACLDLARTVDVLLYNVRPQAMARLGLGYAEVSGVNPKLVYVGAYGFGNAGPYGGRPAYDDLIQGMTAIPSLYQQNSGDVPRYAPLTLADRAVGMQAAIAILAGVIQARASGQGQEIEVPMFEAMAQLVLGDHLGGASFSPPEGPTGYARLLAPYRRPYATSNGYVSVLIYNDKHWSRFFQMIGRPGLLEDERFSSHTARARHIDEAYCLVSDVMATNTSEHWLQAFSDADIPAAPLYGVDDLIADPHLRQVGMLKDLQHPSEGAIRSPAPVGSYSKTPLSIRRHAPRLGEHTQEVLREAGLADEAIAGLLGTGAAAAANKGKKP
ncbi:CaiB/BaiF CoA transferase family protein [Pollutimonas bauzanensis]|uniref:Crotonobetainyl-CoA:carnitine CoA-transferase CaiB n=1 Tax=Pollutimonas bauzanensis TaxID=658167 RepID=A0A1M5UWA2_9BURK|nr:CoA transferase [Pollutimonas bauzanensis]SHH67307.1 Crotonobetainyl-CoA:carnitine CoA-transferase CaiB [Pollutimonas bauzanensis]